MPDLLHKLLKTVDYHRYTFIGLILAAAVIGVATGCQPKAVSPFTGQQVTHDELSAQVDIRIADLQAESEALAVKIANVNRSADPAFAELERERLAINAALAQVTEIARTHGGPYADNLVGALGVAGLLLGGGAVADNRRKDGVIRKQKDEG